MRLLFLKPTLIGDCSYDAGTVADVDVPENVLRDNLIPSGSCRVATGKDAEPAQAVDAPVPKRETAAQKKARLAAEKAAAEKASEDATDTDAQESDEPDADDSADA